MLGKGKKEAEELPVPDNIELRDLAKKEEALFNALMLRDKDLLDDAMSSGFRFNMFWTPRQKELFGLIAKYFQNHQSLLTRTGFETILDQNPKLSNENKAQFRLLFDDLYQMDVKPDDYSLLRESIEGRDIQRKIIHALKKYEGVHSLKSGVKKLLESIQRDIGDIRGVDADVIIRTQTIGQTLLDEVLPELQQRADSPEEFRGIMSGFNCVDSVFNGFLPGKYLVISGRQNGGKTSVMLNMAINMIFAGKVVVFVTIEDDLKKTSTRGLTILTEINFNRILRGGKDQDTGLSDVILSKLREGIDTFTTTKNSNGRSVGDSLYFIETLPDTKWSVINGEINKITSYTDIDVLFVDYLDVVGKEIAVPGRPDLELADVSKRIHAFGKRHKVLTATAQQLRSEKVREIQKKGMTADNFKVGVGDISGTSSIAGAADYIFGIWMDEEARDRMHLYSTKSRHSRALDRFVLSFDGNSGKITDAPTDFDSVEKFVQEHKDETTEAIADIASEIPAASNIEVASASVGESPVVDIWPYDGTSGD